MLAVEFHLFFARKECAPFKDIFKIKKWTAVKKAVKQGLVKVDAFPKFFH